MHTTLKNLSRKLHKTAVTIVKLDTFVSITFLSYQHCNTFIQCKCGFNKYISTVSANKKTGIYLNFKCGLIMNHSVENKEEIVLHFPKDVNKICRTCMKIIETEDNIFENYIMNNNDYTNLYEMLINLTSLKVSHKFLV